MELNQWTNTLHQLYSAALAQYREGGRDAGKFFKKSEVAFLNSIGLRPINLYDYAEDFIKSGEPDWETVLLIVAARRDYYLYEMNSKWNKSALQESDLPPKAEALEGIEWLPRIITKAEAFLKGALPLETMYCCGGDRRFLKDHRLHPADFLRVVWSARDDKNKVLKYVKASARK